MTLTFEKRDLDRVKMNQRVRYLGERSFRLNVIARTAIHKPSQNRPLVMDCQSGWQLMKWARIGM